MPIEGLGQLALVVLTALAPTPETCPIPRRAAVRIDGSGLAGRSEALLERVRTRAEAVLRQWDVRPASAPEDPHIEIAISSLPGATGYRMGYGASAAGHEIAEASGTAECRLCTEDEFIEQLESVVDALVPRLAKATEPVVDPTPVPEPPPRERASTPAPVPTPSWSRLHRAGVGLSIAGATFTGLGLGLSLGEPLLLREDADRRFALWPVGVAVASAGAAMLISGVVALSIERRHRRASRASVTARTARAGLRARR